ncbi:hypothetical protein JCM10212_006538 [Sporobolomyces blumeae]
MDAHAVGTSATHPYTCLSCSLAFVDASSQREHYATELHRYNARRRVAGLAPVTKQVFEDKVQQSSKLVAGQAPGGERDDSGKKLACKACNKTFASSATHEAHLTTKKHKDQVFKAAARVKVADLANGSGSEGDADMASPTPAAATSSSAVASTSTAAPVASTSAAVDVPFESSGDATLDRLVAKRLMYAPPLQPTQCLFCTHAPFSSAQENVAHMRHAHSFAIPEMEYLVDLEGLLRRLGEEVGTWNVCVCCGKGYGGNIELGKEEGQTDEELRKKASKGVEAVRAHMQSKSHCRLKYDTEEEQLNIADFYDFRSSYPDYQERLERRAAKKAAKAAKAAAEGWEDEEMVEGDAEDENAEVVYEDASDSDSDSDDDSDDDDLPNESGITYGDTEYELVLPSGARIGHRRHRNIHKQNFLAYVDGTPFTPPPHASQAEKKPSAHSQALLSLVPMIKKDRTHSRPIYSAGLVPAKGAGFGKGGEVIKARNKGEAKEAGRATREFKELRRFNDQALIKGLRGNNQKHFRDPFLQ